MSNTNMQTQTSSVLQNDTVSSCSISKVQEKTQLSRIKCMNSLRAIQSQLKFLIETLQDFGNMPIFKRTFSQDLDLLENHLTKEIISQTDCKTTLTKLITTFENAFSSEIKARMQNYTRYDAQSFYDAMIFNMDSLGKYMLELILHQQRTPQLLKQKKLMQTQEDHSNPIPALNVDSLKVDLVVIHNTCSEKKRNKIHNSNTWVNVKKSVAERTRHQRQYERRVNKRHMQTQESKIYTGKALDNGLVVMESIRIESEVQDDSSRSGNDTDVDIRPIYDEEPMAEIFLLSLAKKKIQERDRTSTTSVTTSARIQTTVDDSKPKPRSNNQTSRSLPCVFNANHDACITKLLKEVNSHAKIQSHKTRNSNKPVDQKSHTQKPGRQIFTGHRFSPNKTSAVYEKTSPRSDLRWKPTGRIFKSVGLRWIPTGKLFDSCTSKVDSEPPHGSNVNP
ncbi:hypothetical protein Tco_1173476 [Tanacetum coccineum]